MRSKCCLPCIQSEVTVVCSFRMGLGPVAAQPSLGSVGGVLLEVSVELAIQDGTQNCRRHKL
jgi:hypothetical protein